MPLVLSLVFIALAMLVGVVYGRKTAPAPPTPPEPPRFGLSQAEQVKEQLGGRLTVSQAQAAQVAAIVGGMNYALPAEVQKTRERLAASVAGETVNIAGLRQAIAKSEAKISETKARDAEVADLATAFAV